MTKTFYHRCDEARIEEFKEISLPNFNREQLEDIQRKLPNVDMRGAEPEDIRKYNFVEQKVSRLLHEMDKENKEEVPVSPQPKTMYQRITTTIQSFAQSASDMMNTPVLKGIIEDQLTFAKNLIKSLSDLGKSDHDLQSHMLELANLSVSVQAANSVAVLEIVKTSAEKFVQNLRQEVLEIRKNAGSELGGFVVRNNYFSNSSYSPRMLQPAMALSRLSPTPSEPEQQLIELESPGKDGPS